MEFFINLCEKSERQLFYVDFRVFLRIFSKFLDLFLLIIFIGKIYV